MRNLILILFAIFFCFCQNQDSKQTKAENTMSSEQQRLAVQKRAFAKLRIKSVNDVQKKEVQDNFNTWFENYLVDSLKGQINNFVVNVKDLDALQFQDLWVVLADFKTDDGLRLYQEEDLKTEEDMKKHPLYSKIKNLEENKKAMLKARIKKISGYDVHDDLNSLRYPQVYIEVDTVYNLKN